MRFTKNDSEKNKHDTLHCFERDKFNIQGLFSKFTFFFFFIHPKQEELHFSVESHSFYLKKKVFTKQKYIFIRIIVSVQAKKKRKKKTKPGPMQVDVYSRRHSKKARKMRYARSPVCGSRKALCP